MKEKNWKNDFFLPMSPDEGDDRKLDASRWRWCALGGLGGALGNWSAGPHAGAAHGKAAYGGGGAYNP